MTTRLNPRFGRWISDFCRRRVAQALPPQETARIERYLLTLYRSRTRAPAQGRGLSWRRIGEACAIDPGVLAAQQEVLRPVFSALERELAKLGPAPMRKGAEVTGKPRRQQPSGATRPARTVLPVASSAFSDALDAAMTAQEETCADLHRALVAAGARVERSTLNTWRTGRKSPATTSSLRILGLIEDRYELAADILADTLPHRSRAAKGHVLDGICDAERRWLAWHLPHDFASRPTGAQEEILQWVRTRVITGATDYRRYQAAAMKHRYAIKFPAGISGDIPEPEEDPDTPEARDPELLQGSRLAPARLASEMASLLRFKTSTLTAPGYQRRGVWGDETASQKVEHLGLMLGALSAAKDGPVRGRGIPLQALSLGHLIFPAVWDWYVQWRERRRGFYTAWEVDMLNVGVALCAAPTGWLLQTPALAETLKPLPALVSAAEIDTVKADWAAACANLHRHALQRAKEIKRIARVHRDPFEPILPVLEADSPVGEYRKIADEIVRLMPDPRRYPKSAAESVRSLLLIRFGLHLGLRQKNLRELLLCPRGHEPRSERRLVDAKRGELRWSDRESAWEVFIPAVAFKNANSSFFGGSPFRLLLPDLGRLYGYIEDWIGHHRARLLAGAPDPGTVFVKSVKSSSADAAYNQTTLYEVWRLTIQRYGIYNPYTRRGAIPNLLPHGPHNVRDVLATHVLKQTGSFEQASYAIQDTPDVVAKHYGRFLAKDKAALAAQVLNRVWAA